MPNDRFLITGALGCIGAWTVRNLVREGTPVVVFDLASDPRRLKLIMSDDELVRVTFVTGDITDLEALERALDDHAITRVIHLAALQIPFVRANPPLGARVNVVGTVNVFEAVARRRDQIGNLVYASSAAVYDTVDAGESASSPTAPPVTRQRCMVCSSKPTREQRGSTGRMRRWRVSDCARTSCTVRDAIRG
jgi:UDP-glucuronate 4-epimerase